MAKPLPQTIPESPTSSHIPLAYPKILQLENASNSYATHDIREKKRIHARILGYLIREGPSTKAKERVAQEVNSCQNGAEMDKFGEMYYEYLIRIFKKNKGTTPAPSSHPSRTSFEDKREMIMAMLQEQPRDHSAAKKNALVRDNFQCVITGRYDDQSVDKNRELEREAMGSEVVNTQCTHIFPSSINYKFSGSNEDSAKHQYAASIWTILKSFGYEDIPDKLNGDGIHSLDNVLTLDPGIRDFFDRLDIWFEAVDGMENTYVVCSNQKRRLRSCKTNPITFRTESKLPLPNPAYLRIHAACCRVAHLSGAAEHMDKILEDLEALRVLSQDGSSAHVLSFALQPLNQVVFL